MSAGAVIPNLHDDLRLRSASWNASDTVFLLFRCSVYERGYRAISICQSTGDRGTQVPQAVVNRKAAGRPLIDTVEISKLRLLPSVFTHRPVSTVWPVTGREPQYRVYWSIGCFCRRKLNTGQTILYGQCHICILYGHVQFLTVKRLRMLLTRQGVSLISAVMMLLMECFELVLNGIQ